jgi:hypothetical protein
VLCHMISAVDRSQRALRLALRPYRQALTSRSAATNGELDKRDIAALPREIFVGGTTCWLHDGSSCRGTAWQRFQASTATPAGWGRAPTGRDVLVAGGRGRRAPSEVAGASRPYPLPTAPRVFQARSQATGSLVGQSCVRPPIGLATARDHICCM